MKTCPRCKKKKMEDDEIMNSLSRRKPIYICNDCGTEEFLIDLGNMKPNKKEKDFTK